MKNNIINQIKRLSFLLVSICTLTQAAHATYPGAMQAIKDSDLEAFKTHISDLSDQRYRDIMGECVAANFLEGLTYAINSNRVVKYIDVLIDGRKINIAPLRSEPQQLLKKAFVESKLPIIKFLVEHEATNTGSYTITSVIKRGLKAAIESGDFEKIKFLLEYLEGFDSGTHCARSGLNNLLVSTQPEIADLLLNYVDFTYGGASLDDPFNWAVANEHYDFASRVALGSCMPRFIFADYSKKAQGGNLEAFLKDPIFAARLVFNYSFCPGLYQRDYDRGYPNGPLKPEYRTLVESAQRSPFYKFFVGERGSWPMKAAQIESFSDLQKDWLKILGSNSQASTLLLKGWLAARYIDFPQEFEDQQSVVEIAKSSPFYHIFTMDLDLITNKGLKGYLGHLIETWKKVLSLKKPASSLSAGHIWGLYDLPEDLFSSGKNGFRERDCLNRSLLLNAPVLSKIILFNEAIHRLYTGKVAAIRCEDGTVSFEPSQKNEASSEILNTYPASLPSEIVDAMMCEVMSDRTSKFGEETSY